MPSIEFTNSKPNRVLRPDGRYINVPRHRGQLFVCATGCCCGHVARGFAPVDTDLFHAEWERRKFRNKIHLTQGGCLGPCPLANVVTLFFDGRFIGFQGIDDPKLVVAIFDYVQAMMESDDATRVALPTLLRERVFDYFAWSSLQSHAEHDAPFHSSVISQQSSVVSPAGILFLSQADTDILSFEKIRARLPADFPPLYAYNAERLAHAGQIENVLAQELERVQVVVARMLGGRASFRQGLDYLVNACRTHNKDLICVSGISDFDPELTALSNVPLPVIHDTYNYLTLGGLENFENLARYLADNLLVGGFGYDLPKPQPLHGIYFPSPSPRHPSPVTLPEWLAEHYDPVRATAAILFYRAHWLSGNTKFIDAMCDALDAQGLNALPVFTYSLKEMSTERWPQRSVPQPTAFDYFYAPDGKRLPDVVISTMSFAIGSGQANEFDSSVLHTLGVPILQAIASGMERDQWELSARGLSPLDTAMNVALPEFDGRIITVPISFKARAEESSRAEIAASQRALLAMTSTSFEYAPVPDRVMRVAQLARRTTELQRKPNSAKRIAIILTNQPGRASRIGNAVGLDTPASLIHFLHALRDAGYHVQDIPENGDALIHALIDRCAYDVTYLTEFQLAQAIGNVSAKKYAQWFETFPEHNRAQMIARWNDAPGEAYVHDGALKFAGLQFGNVLVALQPPRGYGMDPQAIYHTPDLPPTHHYAAFYNWLREAVDDGGWGADALLHFGKHGTLEWLPGKGIGVSETCFPDLFLGDMPLVYPFIINDPGEGMQAKRRAHAVIVDHLTPPMTTADAYGEIDELRQLVDEYYELEALDPTKLPLLQSQIWELIKRAHLDDDLKLLTKQQHGNHTHDWDPTETEDGTPVSLAEMRGKDFAHLMEDLDGYLCELTSAQIRDGLYIIGEPLTGNEMIDLLVALTRLPNLETPSLRAMVANAMGFDLTTLLDNPGGRVEKRETRIENGNGKAIVTRADAIEWIDVKCREVVASLYENNFDLTGGVAGTGEETFHRNVSTGSSVLQFICGTLVPSLRISQQQETAQMLNALAGKFVPPGPSGAPTRGMAHVLPTGRNFYSVDPRSVPSQTAWRVGQALADELLARFWRDEGAYPETVGLSIWGTSAM